MFSAFLLLVILISLHFQANPVSSEESDQSLAARSGRFALRLGVFG
jgi:hypothetical protein